MGNGLRSGRLIDLVEYSSNIVIRNVLLFRFIVDRKQENGFPLDVQVRDNAGPGRFSFLFGADSQANLITIFSQ